MLRDGTLTYVSLFSCAGVGCYGFHMENYECIATNELITRRLDVQRYNKKCRYDSGYISGDITLEETKQHIYDEIEKWHKIGNDNVDVVIATPPCQGISVINHKKNDGEINRNSLVVESVELIQSICPRFFIFENVMAFQKTLCITPDGKTMPIGEYVRLALGEDYIITGRIMNFMNYGSNSSRTRTLMIGVHKRYRNHIVPFDLYPTYRKEKTLRDVIGAFPALEWGEISAKDFYHAFRVYDKHMQAWIHDLKEGQSAFDNDNPELRPHKNVNGEIIVNVRKNRDKYTRQLWDRFIQCVHTRNDQLAAQNTIHPEQDRVFSIRELMEMMTIPYDFRWIDKSLEELNALSDDEKKRLYKEYEINIRQCIGEAVPTEIMRQIAANIRTAISIPHLNSSDVGRLTEQYKLDSPNSLKAFIESNPERLDLFSLMRIVELLNAKREENAAFYTNKFLVNDIMECLPNIVKDEIHILEPSVGAGSFLPFLIKKYENAPCVYVDVVDIDEESNGILQVLLTKMSVPDNFHIRIITQDFLTINFPYRFDLAIGNPPFSKFRGNKADISQSLILNINQNTMDIAEFFLEKCLRCSDCVALVLNKTILCTEEYRATRDYIKKMRIETIIDFARNGFTGVSIETMCMIIYPSQKPNKTVVISKKYNTRVVQEQNYITDEVFPYFIIYRDKEFDKVASKLRLNVFDVFRDRQITKSNTEPISFENSLWVIKAKNINDDGCGITHITGYDRFISHTVAEKLSVYDFVNRNDIYLTPNMTYNPRVIRNIPNTIADGSVAVLIPKEPICLTDEQLHYFSTDEYRRFYKIARNLSTQSINVDKTSVFFYGVLKNDE